MSHTHTHTHIYIYTEKFCLEKNDENYKDRKKVEDHSHYTGKLRGAAHNICNLKYKVSKDIPIVIHNASYDTQSISKRI